MVDIKVRHFQTASLLQAFCAAPGNNVGTVVSITGYQDIGFTLFYLLT